MLSKNFKTTLCNLPWPRFIREIVGACISYKKRKKEEAERNERMNRAFDWLVEALIDNVIEGWYDLTSQTDPELKTRDGVRQHIRWWNYWRKDEEFFTRNKRYNTWYYIDHIIDEFRSKFPYIGPVYHYWQDNYVEIWRAVRERIKNEIF